MYVPWDSLNPDISLISSYSWFVLVRVTTSIRMSTDRIPGDPVKACPSPTLSVDTVTYMPLLQRYTSWSLVMLKPIRLSFRYP
jgi:hypothetical protein